MINEYFQELENKLNLFEYTLEISIKKIIYGKTYGTIKGIVLMENSYRLAFLEVVDTELNKKDKYKYHFMDANNQLIFRYDNVRHYKEIETFPHHKHIPDGIEYANEPEIDDILKEIKEIMDEL